MRILQKTEAMIMGSRHAVIPYALEVVARPGAREIRVHTAPDGMRIRNGRMSEYEDARE